MSPSTPRASSRMQPSRPIVAALPVAAAPAPGSLLDAFVARIHFAGVRWLVLAMMGALALAVPLATNASVPSRLLARDTFTRTSAVGWKTADRGGAYDHPDGAAGLAVNGETGLMTLDRPGAERSAELSSVDALDVAVNLRISLDTLPTGDGTSVSVLLRRTADHEYRARVRFAADGVFASLWRVRLGTPVAVGKEVKLPAVTARTDRALHVRMRVVGTAPTRFAMKVADGNQALPTAWALDVTDTGQDIRSPGHVGVAAALAADATSAPVRVSIDNLRVRRVTSVAPDPSTGPTPDPTRTPPPTPGTDVTVAVDRFDRTVANGWGQADVGEAYSLFSSASDYSVTGGTGRLQLLAGRTRAATLATATIRDVDLSFRFALDRLPSGSSAYAYGVARHQASGAEYRLKVRVRDSGEVYVQATRFSDGVDSAIENEVLVGTLSATPGRFLWVRGQVTGTGPVQFRMRVWSDGATEPTDWPYHVTDSTNALPAEGSVGMMAHLSTSVSVPAIGLAFDDFRAAAPSDAALPVTDPEPGPTATPTPTATATPAPTTAPTPTSTPSATPSPTTTPTPTPTSTPSPTPTPSGPPPSVPPGAYVVATNGSDSNPGTASAPWATLQKAANNVPAGGTVVVRAGTYAGFTMSRAGSSAAPITFLGDPNGAMPVLDGALGARLDVVKFGGSSHDVRISGFVITGARGGNYAGAGVRTENGASRIVISHNTIRNNRSFGVNSHTSNYVTISDNDISGNEEGIQIAHDGEGTQILDNRVHDNDQMLRNTPASVDAHDDAGATAIGFMKSTGHVLASGNLVWSNRAPSYDYTWDGSAFDIYGASNVTITDNVMWDNETVLETGTDSGTGCNNNVFARNVAWGSASRGRTWGTIIRCGANMLVANNTYSGLEAWAFAIGYDSARFSGTIDGLRVINNVIDLSSTGSRAFGINTALPASVVIDYNLVQTSGQIALLPDGRSTRDQATFTAWTGYQAHGVTGNPLFVDAAGHDFHLRAASPAVDAASVVPGVSDTWTDAAPDMGRFERR